MGTFRPESIYPDSRNKIKTQIKQIILKEKPTKIGKTLLSVRFSLDDCLSRQNAFLLLSSAGNICKVGPDLDHMIYLTLCRERNVYESRFFINRLQREKICLRGFQQLAQLQKLKR